MAKTKKTIKDALRKVVDSGPEVVTSVKVDFRKDGSYKVKFDRPENISVRKLQDVFPFLFREHAAALHQVRLQQRKEERDGLRKEERAHA